MGYNIGISANSLDMEIEIECDKFLNRNYFNWINEYHLLGDKSCISQIAYYLKIDLLPLTKFVNEDTDQNFLPSMQNIDELLSLIDLTTFKVKQKPDLINIILNEELRERWNNYFLKGDFLIDMATLKSSLKCFKSKGFNDVYFFI